MTPDEIRQERKKRLDINSEHFIVKGNVYRVAAMLHPGVVGWWQWGKIVAQAVACVSLQLTLPLFLLHRTLDQWEAMGIRSPYSYSSRIIAVITQINVFASLSYVFNGKVSAEMVDEAEANYY